MNRKAIGLTCAALFVATIYAANYAIDRWGFVSVGFGLMAPAGVYAVGVAFTLRDLTHRFLGLWGVIAAILIGGAASYYVSPAFATASAAAFLVSELADLAVYTPLRRRGWLKAVAASNAVGIVVDSALFLWLAFGSLQYLTGQIVGKAWMTLAAIALIALARLVVARRPLTA